MYQLAICDDDDLHREHTLRCLREIPDAARCDIRTFSDAGTLLAAVAGGSCRPHIAMLDICMPDANGIDLARQLHQKVPDCQVIFLSSFLDFAPAVYDVEHVYFILKSQLDQRLAPALKRAMDALDAVHAQLLLERDDAAYRVPVSEVLYLERVLRKTHVVTVRGDFWSPQVPARLVGESRRFVRCHQSYWVNLARVRCLKNGAFILENDAHIPISRTYQREARDAFFRSLVNGEPSAVR